MYGYRKFRAAYRNLRDTRGNPYEKPGIHIYIQARPIHERAAVMQIDHEDHKELPVISKDKYCRMIYDTGTTPSIPLYTEE
jgi:hypothetical protein